MGLDCSHDAFHGPYSAFNRLRQAIVQATGGSFPPHADPSLDKECWYFGNNFNTESHPGLTAFLSHSDCDGEMPPETCLVVAAELEKLLPTLQGEYVAITLKFIAGCKKAAAANEPLLFQ